MESGGVWCGWGRVGGGVKGLVSGELDLIKMEKVRGHLRVVHGVCVSMYFFTTMLNQTLSGRFLLSEGHCGGRLLDEHVFT